jgi:hypothetical protein
MEEDKINLFRQNFRAFCLAHFKDLKEKEKLKLLPQEEIDIIIKTLDNFDSIKSKTSLQYKWKKQ